jgi:hypothetical protein
MKFATLINTVNIVLIAFFLCVNLISLHAIEEFSREENDHDSPPPPMEMNMIDLENAAKSVVEKTLVSSLGDIDKKRLMLMLIHMYDELGKQENNKIKNKWRYG